MKSSVDLLIRAAGAAAERNGLRSNALWRCLERPESKGTTGIATATTN